MIRSVLVAVMLSVFFLGCAAQKPAPQPVVFADPSLAAAVSAATGIPADQFTAPVLRKLKKLTASGKGIANLGGLEACTGLTQLDLSHNQLQDIGPVAALRGLMKINLSHNQIADLRPLAKLLALVDINLSDNRIADISPLARNNDAGGLPTWTWIYLDDNPLGQKAVEVDIPYLAAEGVTISCSVSRLKLTRRSSPPSSATGTRTQKSNP